MVRRLIQKLFWTSDEGFKIVMCRSPDIISPFHSNLESCYVTIVPFQSFAAVLVQALLSDTCSLYLPLRLAEVGCTLQ